MANPGNFTGSAVVPYVPLTGGTAASPVSAATDDVTFKRADLVNATVRYEKVADCVEGSEAVKAKQTQYLPHPDLNDAYAVKRYGAYLLRAVFYAVTRRTLNGLIGQVFLRDPLIKLPTSIALLEKDADGSGLSLIQISKKAEEYVISYGRCGLLADFPAMDRTVTRLELNSGTIRPTLCLYHPTDVINWRTISHKGRQLLSLVVIAESYVKEENVFNPKYDVQYRVLKLTPVLSNASGTPLLYEYSVEIWRKEGTSNKYVLNSTSYPKNSRGVSLEEIPFTFIGSEDNSPSVDYPPLFDLADLNLAHYRNSADYEESAFIVGQPTPWASGITESWANDVLKGELQIGSRAVILLPENGSCGLLQAEANGMIREAMETKERQMVALGAKLVEQTKVQRTATEAAQDNASESSVLAATASNVSSAFKWALEWCAIFAGSVSQNNDAQSYAVDFKLNTEYELTKLNPEQLKGIMATWQQGALTDEEMRESLIKAGLATASYADWKKAKDEADLEAIQLLETQSALENSQGDNNGE